MCVERKQVLIIDDDTDILEVLQETLEMENYRVATATNVNGASEQLAAALPDLIILDLVLPDGNGFELCRKITSDPATSNVPVLLLTGKNSLDDRISGFLTGARKYITKPFDIDNLMDAVRDLILKSSQANA
jgi:DNA-binding response OmpR family regulator